ncbi:MAG: dihydroorotate dehydrogenase electron transfer subunit [bacterium]|nr:dihydroorotate dehydrogenase electron transfer subunit [bacterium]
MTKPACHDGSLTKIKDLKADYFSITVAPFPHAAKCQPGQFVHLQIPSPELFFRRAFSIAGVTENKDGLEIIFKVFGRGTKILSDYCKGESVNVLGPLGVPFKLPSKREKTIIVAGGVGFPPLMFLAQRMIEKGYNPKSIQFFYGGRSAGDIVEKARLKRMGLNLFPVTEDGSVGARGLVTTEVKKYIMQNGDSKLRMYACGPEGMLKAVDDLGQKLNVPGQVSLEAPMPCGVGICLGCIVPLRKGGNARVCCDGPVFKIGEVLL